MSGELSATDELEQARIADLLGLVPEGCATALDVGARDGRLSIRLAGHVGGVTALDLSVPQISHPRVRPVSGNATQLGFPDSSFDLVLCSEVLEHIPPPGLEAACRELIRVSRRYVVIGVPFREDIRANQTTCATCGAINPPWGHVNSFDERRLARLFPGVTAQVTRYVGRTRRRTNALSAALSTFAGNPWGTYGQAEACVACGAKLLAPAGRNLVQKVATRVAHILDRIQHVVVPAGPNWIHILYVKDYQGTG